MIYKSPLKPCPWCKSTPKLNLPIEQDTWVWHIYCGNPACQVSPQGRHISIRNTGKKRLTHILSKLSILFNQWNLDNPLEAYEAKNINLGELKLDI